MQLFARILILSSLIVAGCGRIDSATNPASSLNTAPYTFNSLAFDRYHSQTEIAAYLRQAAADHSDFAKFEVLGASRLGREVAYLAINRTGSESSPAILLNGTHHGNEKSSTESVLAVADYLLSHSDETPIAELLSQYAVYLLPLVNPDGHNANSREDSTGTDPNRDYAYPNRTPDQSFRLQEIKLLRGLQDQVKFRAAIAYHSGMTGVLWPWCYSGTRSSDYDAFYTISKKAAEAMGFQLYVQSYFDYATRGEYTDYAYMAHRTLAVTFEVSGAGNPSPSQLPAVVRNATGGTLAFIQAVHDLDKGLLQVESETEQHFGVAGPAWQRGGPRLE